MRAEIIAVGTELLLGHTINSDAAHVGRELSALGIDVLHSCVVGDNPRRLEDALREALSRSDLVITTGGLGPTEDDLTKETIAAVLDMPLEEDADSLELDRLTQRLAEGEISELILALGATIEAENTASFLREMLARRFPRIRISRLAQGIPLGAEVKYMDRETLRQSLQFRQQL